MSRTLPIREASAVLTSMLVGAAVAIAQVPANGSPRVAQSSLPAAQPTSNPATNQTGAPSSTSQAAAKAETRLDVIYANGMLTVNAANAGLNQVLHQVSEKTGMKVTGTVSEESVFGQYGPSPVAEVLASLLDGTGSNMLLVDSHSGPAELILTPRHGGVSPPSPNSGGNNSRGQFESQEPQYVPPVRPFQPPTITGRGPIGTNADGSPAFGHAPGGGGSNAGEQQKTPQEIYEQLQQQGSQQQASPQQ